MRKEEKLIEFKVYGKKVEIEKRLLMSARRSNFERRGDSLVIKLLEDAKSNVYRYLKLDIRDNYIGVEKDKNIVDNILKILSVILLISSIYYLVIEREAYYGALYLLVTSLGIWVYTIITNIKIKKEVIKIMKASLNGVKQIKRK